MTERSEHRIASLLAGSTEILCGLGAADRIVGISHECDYPPEILDRPRLTRSRIDDSRPSDEIDAQVKEMMQSGATLYEVDSAMLRELRPTVIVTQAQCEVCAVSYDDVAGVVATHHELRDARLVAMNPMTLDDLFRDIAVIARAIGEDSSGEAYVRELRRRLDRVRSRSRPSGVTAPRLICIEWIEPMMIAANWMPDLIAAAGGRCDLTKSGVHSSYTDWATVVEYDPEIIVVSPCGFNLTRTLAEAAVLPALPSWSSLRAVRDGRVYAVDGNVYFNRSGPRLVDSVELLAGLIDGPCDDPLASNPAIVSPLVPSLE